MTLPQDAIKTMLHYQEQIEKTEWVIFSLSMVLGIACIFLGLYFFVQYLKSKLIPKAME